MLGLTVTTEDTTQRVEKAVEKTAYKNFRHAAASMSKDAKSSLEKAPQGEASQAGEPPHTHQGTYLRRAVRYEADEEGAVIGPVFSAVEDIGGVHEHGEEYEGIDYEERPFMGPALERGTPRFAGSWSGSIGE